MSVFTLPQSNVVAGQTGHLSDHNDIYATLNNLVTTSVFNVQNTAYGGGAKGNGSTDDTAALQAAINAAIAAQNSATVPQALVTTVFLPYGNYLISSPLSITTGIRLCGESIGSRIFSSASGIIDFGGNNFISGLEIDHLTLDATGGHIFNNICIHRSTMHHLQLVQRSGTFSVMNWGSGSGLGLSTTEFYYITQAIYGDPSTGLRTVPAWNLFSAASKIIDVVTWRKVTSLNEVNNSALDNTQFIFDIACTAAAAGGVCDRLTFDQCDFDRALGGAIRLQSCQGVLINQAGTGNVFNQNSVTVGNSFIYLGNYAGNNAANVAEGTSIVGYCRETGGTITFGSFSDIEIDSASTNLTVITPTSTGLNDGVRINVNSTATACTIIDPQSNVTILNQAPDTLVVTSNNVNALRASAGTSSAGVALINGTQNFCTWTTPNDGKAHAVTWQATLNVTSNETGGAVQIAFTNIVGSGGSAAMFASGLTTGANNSTGSRLVAPNTTVTIQQSAALTGGAAVVWAQIWGG